MSDEQKYWVDFGVSPEKSPTHQATGTAKVVAAALRAIADQLDPPQRPAMRRGPSGAPLPPDSPFPPFGS